MKQQCLKYHPKPLEALLLLPVGLGQAQPAHSPRHPAPPRGRDRGAARAEASLNKSRQPTH